ncbi:MAG: hemolysin family protein [Velocimicrobium sp.]
MEDSNPWWYLGVILILIVIEAVMVSAKKALESINETSMRRVPEDKTLEKKMRRVLVFLEEEEQYISTMQFMIAMVNIVIGALYANKLSIVVNDVSNAFAMQSHQEIRTIVLLILFTILLLFLVILFASVIPIKLAILNPEKVAIDTSGIVQLFHLILRPFNSLLSNASKLFFWVLHTNPEDFEDNVTEDEIISIVNEGFEQGVLEDNEVEMISNIIELDDKEVRDVMTNRRNVVSISAELSLGEALKFMLGERYSRFPLYEEERDNIIGILHFKDVTQHYIAGEDGVVSLKEISRKPYFVPDTQSVDTLFNEMQLRKIHMSIAVDEYGQMAGVVALEDILEEIVGNILDEYDEDERMILKQGNNRYIMRGMAPLDEVEDVLGINMEHEHYDIDTLNGFLISFLGHLPGNDEKSVVRYEGYRFHVLDAKNNIIRTVRVVKEQDAVNERN